MERKVVNTWIPELLELQAQLLAAARSWSQGAPMGPETDALLEAALRINHTRYAELIPAYRWLAEGQGLLDAVDLDTIVNQLMFTDEVFKSYDPALLDGGDFAGLSRWLETVFTRPIELDAADIQDLGQWRTRLRQQGIFLTYSSGTSGRLSFVPRDSISWKALCFNSRTYADQSWFADADGRPRPFDCLVAAPRGDGMGIQGAASGLARLARHAHFLFDRVLTEEMARDLSLGLEEAGQGSSAATRVLRQQTAHTDPYRRAFDFVRRGMGAQRPLLIFGTPFQLQRLCDHALSHCGRLQVAPNSIVVTGGGWKSFQGEHLPASRLRDRIDAAFGISADRVIDAYSTAELNCTLITCCRWRYHIPPLIQPVVLDDTFSGSVGQQGVGTLGFLDPFAASYPGFIITGDVGQLQRGECDCGKTGWFIEGEIRRAPGRQLKGCGGVMAAIAGGSTRPRLA